MCSRIILTSFHGVQELDDGNQIEVFFLVKVMNGWWYTYPSQKY